MINLGTQGLRNRLNELRRKRHAQGGRLDPLETEEQLQIMRLIKRLMPSNLRKPPKPPKKRGNPEPQSEDERLILDELKQLDTEGVRSVGFWKLLSAAARRAPDYDGSTSYVVAKKRALMQALMQLVKRGIVGRRRPKYFLT
jgi:hypothetical protein